MTTLSTTIINVRELYPGLDHEKVLTWRDRSCNYRGIIAIHSTVLGPAVGGTRFWNYADDEDAIIDGLRLSRGMTYKNALAGLPFGGGKAIIIGNNATTSRERIFRAHGRLVETLKGTFITAEDVGTDPADMEYVRRETKYVAGLPGCSGDPSPMTAYGVFRALEAAAKHRWGKSDLAGRTVAIQGCGKTGYYIAAQLHKAGVRLLVTDLDKKKVRRVVSDFGATALEPDEIFRVGADIFAPCALGGVINDQTIGQLKVEIVAGSANNQLLEDRHGDDLHEMGILFAPDYVSNAGGIINGCRDLLDWTASATTRKVHDIYERMLTILDLAKEANFPPFRMANRLAQDIISSAQAEKCRKESRDHGLSIEFVD